MLSACDRRTSGDVLHDFLLSRRGPVADRLYLSSADGGRAITDAVAETYHIAKYGYALTGIRFVPPKQGARFTAELFIHVYGTEWSEGDVLVLRCLELSRLACQTTKQTKT
jgi:hypothetical protein